MPAALLGQEGRARQGHTQGAPENPCLPEWPRQPLGLPWPLTWGCVVMAPMPVAALQTFLGTVL